MKKLSKDDQIRILAALAKPRPLGPPRFGTIISLGDPVSFVHEEIRTRELHGYVWKVEIKKNGKTVYHVRAGEAEYEIDDPAEIQPAKVGEEEA